MTRPTSPSLPHKTTPTPNFFSTHSVVLPHPLKEVYITLGTSEGHERACRLSKLCSGFELLHKDVVHLPVEGYPDAHKLSDVGLRVTEPKDVESTVGQDQGQGQEMKTVITRQHFTMEETVPLVFGLIKTKVRLTGTLSWNQGPLDALASSSSPSVARPLEPLEALYETITNQGIVVWKIRQFEEVADKPGSTKVSERIEGWAPSLLRPIVQREAENGHRAHMEQYHTLF